VTRTNPATPEATKALLRYEGFVASEVFSSLYIDNALLQARAETYLASDLSVNIAVPARLVALAISSLSAFIPAPVPGKAALTKHDYVAGIWRGRYPVYALWKLPPFAFVLFTGNPEHLQDALYQAEPPGVKGLPARNQ